MENISMRKDFNLIAKDLREAREILFNKIKEIETKYNISNINKVFFQKDLITFYDEGLTILYEGNVPAIV